MLNAIFIILGALIGLAVLFIWRREYQEFWMSGISAERVVFDREVDGAHLITSVNYASSDS
jgi:hypothetical protein